MVGEPFPMEPVLAFGWISFFLLLGMYLRAKIPLFRKYLIPACLIGGTVGFFANTFGLLGATGLGVSSKALNTIAYHLFNLTWIMLGLQGSAGKMEGGPARTKRCLWMFGVQLSTITICFTAVLLGGILLRVFGNTDPASLGALIATGFIGGPGHAMTRAAIWEKQGGLTGLVPFGLAGSSTGYLLAMIVGIPLMNMLARRRKMQAVTNPSEFEQRGFYAPDEGPIAGRQTTVTNCIETLSWHLGIAIAGYLAILGLYFLAGKILSPKMMAMAWGLFFAIALTTGILIRKSLHFFKLGHLSCHNITNRVSCLLVDYLVCATFITIQVGAVQQYLIPFITAATISLLSVLTVLWIFTTRIKENAVETFGMLFGTLTGTISTGLLLMRIVDPDCKTPVPQDYGIATLFLYPYALMTAVVVHWEIVMKRSVWSMVAFFAAWAVVGLAVALWFKREKFASPSAVPQHPESAEAH